MMSRASSRRKRGLRQIGHAIRIGNLKRGDFRHIRNHLRHIRRFAQRALNLVVVAMPNQHQRITLLGELDRLDVDLRDQRAGRVDHLQTAPFAPLAHRRRNSVRGVDYTLPIRHVVDLVDKDRALFRQLIHNIAVVDNFAAHVNGRAKGLQARS